jgi:hypothetical protein
MKPVPPDDSVRAVNIEMAIRHVVAFYGNNSLMPNLKHIET